MEFYVILLISVGLSMDSLAVSIADGICLCKNKTTKSFQIALSFAVFQALFPLIGWYAGKSFSGLISSIDHWLAFILLLIIGGKMIIESISSKQGVEMRTLNMRTIILQSIATSIDAFAIGLSLSLLGVPVLLPVVMIGITTFVFSFVGVQLGRFLGLKIGKFVDIIGGIILIGIGTKILIEHLTA